MSDQRRIERGVYKGMLATIKRIDGTHALCDVMMFGREVELDLPLADLRSAEVTDEDVRAFEDEVRSAARSNAPDAYRRTIWLTERVREGVDDRDLPRLVRELAQLDAEMEERARPHIEDALAKFRVAFAAVPPMERLAWWNTHRETWTARNDNFRAVSIALFGRVLEGSEDYERMLGPGRRLLARLESARHVGFTDDLDGTAPIAVNPALESAIEAAPDDIATWSVYADWLQQHGDPRGELAVLDGDEALRFVNRHERYLLGGLALHHEIVSYTWRRGWLRTAKVMTKRAHEEAGISQAALVATLLGLPSSRFLETLTLGAASIHEDGVAEAMIDALVAGGRRPMMRTLTFDTDRNEEMLSWTETGSLERALPVYPNLETLEVVAGTLSLGALDLPTLARLRIETCGLTIENLHAIIGAQLPALRSIELWFGRIDALGLAMSVVETFARAPHLGLVNTSFTDELAIALAESPSLVNRETLDLSRGTLTDRGAYELARAIATGRAPRLARLDVRASYLTDDGMAALRGTNLTVISDDQRVLDGERYVDVWE